jgi:lambda repressor-like predicted transcriptional regulator
LTAHFVARKMRVMCNSTPAATVHRIVAYAEAQGWSKLRFAKEAKIQDTTLRKLGRPDWNPTLRVLNRLSAIIPEEFCPERHNGNRRGRKPSC